MMTRLRPNFVANNIAHLAAKASKMSKEGQSNIINE